MYPVHLCIILHGTHMTNTYMVCMCRNVTQAKLGAFRALRLPSARQIYIYIYVYTTRLNEGEGLFQILLMSSVLFLNRIVTPKKIAILRSYYFNLDISLKKQKKKSKNFKFIFNKECHFSI